MVRRIHAAVKYRNLQLANAKLVSELIPKLRFHYISLHWVSDYLPLSLNQERF